MQPNLIDKLKAEMIKLLFSNLEKLKIDPSSVSVNFTIGLGRLWYNVEQENSLWKSRYNLIIVLNSTFGVEPEVAGETINFIVNNASMQSA